MGGHGSGGNQGCSICASPEAEAINARLLAGELGRVLAKDSRCLHIRGDFKKAIAMRKSQGQQARYGKEPPKDSRLLTDWRGLAALGIPHEATLDGQPFDLGKRTYKDAAFVLVLETHEHYRNPEAVWESKASEICSALGLETLDSLERQAKEAAVQEPPEPPETTKPPERAPEPTNSASYSSQNARKENYFDDISHRVFKCMGRFV